MPVVEYIAPPPAVSYADPAPGVEFIPPVVSYVTPVPVIEYSAPVSAVDDTPALSLSKYILPAAVGDPTPAPVVECIASMPAVYAVPAPVDEYIAPMTTTCAAPTTAIEYNAPAPAGSYVAPAPGVDAPGSRKSARLSPNAPEIFEFECGRRSSLHPVPKRRRQIADDEMLPELYEIDEDAPEVDDIADREFEEAANNMLTHCQRNEMVKHGKLREIQREVETETRRVSCYIVEEIYRVGESPQHRKRWVPA